MRSMRPGQSPCRLRCRKRGHEDRRRQRPPGLCRQGEILALLTQSRHEGLDYRARDPENVDYPIRGESGPAVSEKKVDRAFSSVARMGMCIVGNKFAGRAAPCHDDLTAEMSRLHNDATCCASRHLLGDRLVNRMVEIWLTTTSKGAATRGAWRNRAVRSPEHCLGRRASESWTASPRMVVGYHGCEERFAGNCCSAVSDFRMAPEHEQWTGSVRDLFLEHAPERALRWARSSSQRAASAGRSWGLHPTRAVF